MARKGRVIGLINIFLIIITIAVLVSTFFCYWINSTVAISSIGEVKSDISLREYKFTVSVAGIETRKTVKLSEACRDDTKDVVNAKSDEKLCKLYRGSLILTILTALGLVVSIINAVLIVVFLTCVNGHTTCFKLVTIFLSLGCLCLYAGSIVSYSLAASDIDDVKYRFGWIIYVIGCVFAVVSLGFSIFTSNTKGYVTLG